MKLFISYSRDDKAWTYELENALREAAGYDVWIDKHIIPSADWWETILEEIENCECFIYILSSFSVRSIYCRAELSYALALNKPIFPLMLKICDYPDELNEKRVQYAEIDNARILYEVLFKIEQGFRQIDKDRFAEKYEERTASRPPLPKSELKETDPPSEVQQMVEVLNTSWNPEDKIVALQLLGKRNYKDAIPAIGDRLTKDQEVRVRLEAAKSLEAIGSKEAIQYFLIALKDDNPSVRNAVVKRLGVIGGAEVVENIASTLDDKALIVRNAAIDVLSELAISNEDAATYLIQHYIELKRSDDNDTGRIFQVVAKLRDEVAIPVLINLLNDKDSHVRGTAVTLLSRYKNSDTEQHIADLLENDDEFEVRRLALYALGSVNIEKAVPHLLNALNSEKSQMRVAGASILRHAPKSENIISGLQKALGDEDENVRRQAKRSLDELKNPTS